MNKGIPPLHQPFWREIGVSDVHKIYLSPTVNLKKILSLITSEPSNKNEQRVLGYLETMIGNLSLMLLRRFLRFVTGSSVCSEKEPTTSWMVWPIVQ